MLDPGVGVLKAIQNLILLAILHLIHWDVSGCLGGRVEGSPPSILKDRVLGATLEGCEPSW